jgi:hypothetical protein
MGTELRALIDKRIKAGTVSSATPLEEHLRQLETLSKARRNRGGILSDVMFSGLLDGNSTRDYFNFIDEIFEVKKRQIKDLLKLDS